MTAQDRRRQLAEQFRPEELGLLAKQLRAWQRATVLGWSLAILALLGVLVLAMRPALIPYPLVYDPDGRLIWHGTAATAREERFIDVRLVEWVVLARAVTSDEPRFREDRQRAAAMVYGKAAEKFAAYAAESIGAYKDVQRRVLVKVHWERAAIVREAADRVRLSWEETWTPEFGYGSETHQYQATLTHAWYAKPSGWTLDRARLNPSRVYVTDYWWDEVRQEAK